MEDENLLPRPAETSPEETSTESKSKWSTLGLGVILLVVYIIFGVSIYLIFRDEFKGDKTNVMIDALYFTIVTFSTVGYGDIVPLTSTTKILTILLVLMGAVFLNYLLNRVMVDVLSLQENLILDQIRTRNSGIIDHIAEDGRIMLKWKLLLPFCFVCTCLGIGIWFIHQYQGLDGVDSVYLTIISVTTVGYGDITFERVEGRCFAVFWLLFSTISMATFFVYFAEIRIYRTPPLKLPTSESEFFVSKLKESGKFSEDEIREILTEFENRD